MLALNPVVLMLALNPVNEVAHPILVAPTSHLTSEVCVFDYFQNVMDIQWSINANQNGYIIEWLSLQPARSGSIC
uniref:Uncharacterized protein n=1 Tax=Arundo donax TaxID=35708 RepID=A0A0A9EIM7_ARUDO